MPTKLKPSVKTYNRKTGKTTTEHFYMKTMSKESLFEYINDDRGKPKIKQKCRNELSRRGVKIVMVPKEV
jgi:aspartate/glutamate racemase|tara:strand:+ start:44 stop:253 length:210 start_codon:yes stop_codon:yes gene_type:complete